MSGDEVLEVPTLGVLLAAAAAAVSMDRAKSPLRAFL